MKLFLSQLKVSFTEYICLTFITKNYTVARMIAGIFVVVVVVTF